MSDPRGEYGLMDFLLRQGAGRKVLYRSDAQSAHAGGAEANVASFTLSKETLRNAGEILHVRASGTFAANANAKRVRLLLGSMVPVDSVSSTSWNGHKWTLEAFIARVTSASQKSVGRILAATAAGAAAVLGTDLGPVAGTEDLTTDLTVAVKATGVAGSDVVLESILAEVIGPQAGW